MASALGLRRVAAMLAAGLLAAVGLAPTPVGSAAPVADRAVPAADCGPGSLPETGLQGQVPQSDRDSGRSTQGYRCNLQLVGQHQGEGASIQNAWYGDCDYYGTAIGGPVRNPGVQVVDVADPARPKVTARLVSPAMTEPWESLKVHEARGLLAAVHGGVGLGPVFFDVYDVKTDCRAPRLLSSLPLPSNIIGHEGTWAPDGRTYWVGMIGGLAAIDVADPTRTRLIYADDSRVHGLSLSDDGNVAYLAAISVDDGEPNGLRILDVSDVQARQPLPQVREISHLYWADGAAAQHTIPVTYGGRPFLFFVDEGGSRYRDRSEGLRGLRSPAGAARLIDISDIRRPYTVAKLKLEIQLPTHERVARWDLEGNGMFGYQGHYCSVDRPVDPTALACSYFQSGIRVFDVRDPYSPREIAYFNPPAQTGKQAQLPGSWHVSSPARAGFDLAVNQDSTPRPNLTADWCMAQVRFYPARNELWTHCLDNGFLVMRFTNGVYPLPPLERPVAFRPAADFPAEPVSARGPIGYRASATRQQLAYRCIIVPGISEQAAERLLASITGTDR
ncbi:MAG: hypothetical protein AB1679_03920 [Actinomycetota bacterium]|jgi:hypothetical protein